MAASKSELSIGVDLGGTQLRAALVDASGSIVAVERVKTDRKGGANAIVAQILALVAALRDDKVKAVGIGIPGAFDGVTGTVLGIPALAGWTGIPLAAIVEEKHGLACYLENDATAAAIGEWRAGAGQNLDHFVYVTISTGIGGGIIVDGRVLRGSGGLAGEIGHMKISDHSETCSCGKIGCWEAVAAGTALGRRARTASLKPEGARILQLAGSEEISAFHVGVAAREGDPAAVALLQEEAGWIGQGIVNVQHLYAPDRIVVGGGVSQLLDLMIDDIRIAVGERLLPGFKMAEIVPTALGDDAGLIGTALHAMERQSRGRGVLP